jgi:hypothetical protein
VANEGTGDSSPIDTEDQEEAHRKSAIYHVDMADTAEEPTRLDLQIRKDHSDVFSEPQDLPPRRPYIGTGDFKIRLLVHISLAYWITS